MIVGGCEGGVQARDLAERVARQSYGKLVAFLSVKTRDVAAAEDALAEAFAAALRDWPVHGCPDNPEAWLLTVARRKFLDEVRGRVREISTEGFEETIAAIAAESVAAMAPITSPSTAS